MKHQMADEQGFGVGEVLQRHRNRAGLLLALQEPGRADVSRDEVLRVLQGAGPLPVLTRPPSMPQGGDEPALGCWSRARHLLHLE